MGIRSISAYLRDRGVETKLIFAPLFENRLYSREHLNQLKELVKGDDVIGISTAGISHSRTMQLLRAIRDDDNLKDKFVIVGGPTASLSPGVFFPLADGVCQGEGESATCQLVQSLQKGEDFKGVKNFWFRVNGKIVKNPVREPEANLDKLPIEDYDFQDGHHFRLTSQGIRQITSARQSIPGIPNLSAQEARSLFVFGIRGCSYGCTYCINNWIKTAYQGKWLRKRSVTSLVENMQVILHAHQGVRHVSIFDDDFFLRSLDEIKEFAVLYRQKINLPFFAYATPATFSEEKLELLAGAGMTKLGIGFQTGSKRMLKIYQRPIKDIERAPGIIKSITKMRARYPHFGLADVDFLIDSPLEKASDVLDTIKLLRKMVQQGEFEAQMHNLHLFPGSCMYNTVLASLGSNGSPKSDPRLGFELEFELQDHRPKIEKKIAVIEQEADPEKVWHAFYTVILFLATGKCGSQQLGVLSAQELNKLLAPPLVEARKCGDFFRQKAKEISTTIYYNEQDKEGKTIH